jgi:hypothetical protein
VIYGIKDPAFFAIVLGAVGAVSRRGLSLDSKLAPWKKNISIKIIYKNYRVTWN